MNTELDWEDAGVPLKDLVVIAEEHWRLSQWLESLPLGKFAALPRRSLGLISDILRRNQVETKSFDGHPFDPGLAVRVVDTQDDFSAPEGSSVILETVSPQVVWRGKVIKPADVVTVRGMMK